MKPHKPRETHARTLAKSITWRIVATVSIFLLVVIFTGRFDTALGISFLDFLIKSVTYYGHERLWSRVEWGRIASKD